MWNAGYNMPGYLPESEPAEFEYWEEAREYLLEELRRAGDGAWEWADAEQTGDGYNDAVSIGNDLDIAAQLLRNGAVRNEEWDYLAADGYIYWLELATGE